jgi:hypothetical protein
MRCGLEPSTPEYVSTGRATSSEPGEMGGLALWTDVPGDCGDAVRGDTLLLMGASSCSSPRANRASIQNDFLRVTPLLLLLLLLELLAALAVSSAVVAAILVQVRVVFSLSQSQQRTVRLRPCHLNCTLAKSTETLTEQTPLLDTNPGQFPAASQSISLMYSCLTTQTMPRSADYARWDRTEERGTHSLCRHTPIWHCTRGSRLPAVCIRR